MTKTLKTLAIAAALAVGTAGAAMAQCPAGYNYYGGVCQPYAYAPANPVSGAATGAAAGAATGAAVGGPVGAVVGGAIGTATGAAAGTVNAATGAPVAAYGSSYPPPPAPACGPGYVLYNGGCYPAR
ncbi:MAG: hypothetical protein ACM3JG_05660 [Thiohalocapsa sp.]